MLPAGLEPTIPGSKRLQTHALDRAATGIGRCSVCGPNMMYRWLRGFLRRKKLLTCCGTVHSVPLLTSKMVAVCVGQTLGSKYGPQQFFSHKEHMVVSSILKLSARVF